MKYKEIQAKSILRKHKKIDSWFVSRYGMNLFRGCQHNCSYCDGRAEGYYVEGNFGEEVEIKINAPEILDKELNPANKRKPLKKGFIILGGGVCDSYQPIEAKVKLTQNVLRIIKKYNYPVHILTKSTLVKRDIELIKSINEQTKVIVSFSFSSTDDEISKIFEPHASIPSSKLETISIFKKHNIACGMYLMPVIPFITDNEKYIEKSIADAKNAGIDFIVFGGMTLKQGRQWDYYMNALNNHFPEISKLYRNIYYNNKWGSPTQEYYKRITDIYLKLSAKYKMPKRIPSWLFNDQVDKTDLVVVILEQLDIILKMKGEKSFYGLAANSIIKTEKPIEEIKNDLLMLSGIGKITEMLIQEIIETGTSQFYEKNLIN
ncbi:radical SAM protein [Bacteroidota bacterium]